MFYGEDARPNRQESFLGTDKKESILSIRPGIFRAKGTRARHFSLKKVEGRCFRTMLLTAPQNCHLLHIVRYSSPHLLEGCESFLRAKTVRPYRYLILQDLLSDLILHGKNLSWADVTPVS